jgi:uncharacterized membrane protein
MEIYNQTAGKNRDRLAALSDGVFAFALTVVVLDIRVPGREGVTTESGLWTALGALLPHFTVYVLAFLTLGILWVGQQAQLNLFARTDRDLTWIHLLFLASVAMLPFTTSLLASFTTLRLALVIYWANIFIMGFTLLWGFHHARQMQLFKSDVPAKLIASIPKRILIAQGFYAFGALLCVFGTYVSIAFIILVQLYYAFAPNEWFLRHASKARAMPERGE